eukprot:CAMPEP_0197527408 /NCGR_PEP_ID=MMETSP1318-20131121/21483_1 /TAXON_ID=552666 /ORGANISM="Partenskyella glossopodia, Strain RCC365" /LENGTH=317 /DNA_ID=CAMNT_0043082029 /DNA_START=147 /DNA_END=1100 /DNA_ORIENTATION=+
MSLCDHWFIIFTTIVMYVRLLIDLFLCALYLSGDRKTTDSSIQIDNQDARDALGTFIIMLLPGFLNLLNLRYTAYPEDNHRKFQARVERYGLYSLPFFFPEGFEYAKCNHCRRCCGRLCCGCCSKKRQTQQSSFLDGVFVRFLTVTQLRAAYDCVVSLVDLNRVLGSWRDCILTSILVHAFPQAIYQATLMYYGNKGAERDIIGIGTTIYTMQLLSMFMNLVGIALMPNEAPLFDAAYRRESILNCWCQEVVGEDEEIELRGVATGENSTTEDKDPKYSSGPDDDNEDDVKHRVGSDRKASYDRKVVFGSGVDHKED